MAARQVSGLSRGKKNRALWGNATKAERPGYKSAAGKPHDFWRKHFTEFNALPRRGKVTYFLNNFCSKETRELFNRFAGTKLTSAKMDEAFPQIERIEKEIAARVEKYAGKEPRARNQKLLWLTDGIWKAHAEIKSANRQINNITIKKFPFEAAANFRHSTNGVGQHCIGKLELLRLVVEAIGKK
ncbi:Uncharacterised protein [uncultured archaeon]|nr:Uncharacterised protein [uncultured archaeon]